MPYRAVTALSTPAGMVRQGSIIPDKDLKKHGLDGDNTKVYVKLGAIKKVSAEQLEIEAEEEGFEDATVEDAEGEETEEDVEDSADEDVAETEGVETAPRRRGRPRNNSEETMEEV